MATAIQWRRGNTSQHANFTGLSGEITVDTDLNTLIVHDGSTQGGVRLAKYSEVQAAAAGDITAVIAGSGITGGSLSGNATLAIDYENLSGNLIPSANNTYSLGNASSVWKDVYVGPGSLYVNGQQVLSDNAGTIQISADTNQNISILTVGSGDIELTSGGEIQIKSNLVMSAGKTISTAGGGATSQTSNIDMNSNYINNLGTPVANTDAATKGYVDTDSTVVRVTGTQTIAGAKTFSDDAVFSGNLTVSGTQTIINTETLTVDDNIIVLNNNATGSASQNAGIEVERGDDANKQLLWNETDDKWSVGSETFVAGAFEGDLTGDVTGNVTGTVSSLSNHDTADLAEGTNLYWTTARGNSAIDAYLSGGYGVDISSGAISVANADVRGLFSATGDLSYNASTGAFSFTNDAGDIEGVTAGFGLSGGGTAGTVSLELANSDVRGLFSASGDLAYNASTGVFSFTNDAGDIESVTAGDGLTGGGASGAVTLDIGQGTGITVNADNVAVNMGAFDTDDLAEGSTNLYFTNARADARVQAAIDTDVAFGSASDTLVPSQLAVKTYVDAQVDTVDALSELSGDTDDITEGSVNLYYTDARAQAVSINNVVEDTSPQLGGTLDMNSQLVTGDIIPSANVTYNLGNATNRFNDLFLAGNTIFMGNSTISLDAAGDVEIKDSSNSSVLRKLVVDELHIGTGSNKVKIKANNGKIRQDNNADSQTALDFSLNDTDDLAEGSSNLYWTSARGNSAVDAYLSGGTGITYAGGVLSTTDSEIVHDNLSGFVADEHVAHSGVTLTAGAGLTGGGDITTSRSFAVGAGAGITVNSDDVALASSTAGAGLTFSTGVLAVGAGDGITVNADDVAVDSTVVRTSGTQTIGGAKTFSDDMVLSGNLTVNGTQTIMNTTVASLADNIVELNRDASGAPSEDAGLQVNRGSSSDVFLKWDESSDEWQFTNDGSTYYALSKNTDDLAEGSTNLYYTDARAQAAIAVSDAGGDGSLSYSGGTITYTGPSAAEVRAHFSGGTGVSISSGTVSIGQAVGTSSNVTFNTVTADLVGDVTGTVSSIANHDTDDVAEGASNLYYTDTRFDTRLAAKSTSDLSEGSNLYWTTSRGNAAINAYLSGGYGVDVASGAISVANADIRGLFSASGDLSYNASTGAFSFTNDAGDIEGVTAGAGLTGGGTSGTVNIDVVGGYGITANANDITISNSDVRGLFSASGDISYNSTTGVFSFTNDAGDIESVTAGNGLTGGGTSGAVTLNVGAGTGISVAADAISVSGLTVSEFAAGSYLASGETFSDTDSQFMTAAAINDRIQAFGYTTNTGDITGVTAGNGLTGGGASGSVTLNVVGGTGISVAADSVSVDMSAFDTGDLAEGSNLYYTVARANSAIDARVTKSMVDALGINATTVDGIDSSAFLRSNTADSHSGTITPSTNNSINLGSSSYKYANVYATTFQGTATSAQYADLAEKYESDMELEAGTVVCFGGEKEITACSHDSDHRVAGVISTDPAYMMNSDGEGQYVALTGRVPCKVVGPVAKGDLLVSSDVLGHARADNDAKPGRIIGKAVGSIDSGEGVIEVLVNMM